MIVECTSERHPPLETGWKLRAACRSSSCVGNARLTPQPSSVRRTATPRSEEELLGRELSPRCGITGFPLVFLASHAAARPARAAAAAAEHFLRRGWARGAHSFP